MNLSELQEKYNISEEDIERFKNNDLTDIDLEEMYDIPYEEVSNLEKD